jgi:KaiC/GvpD/RAD55 family RecA-like ATPase
LEQLKSVLEMWVFTKLLYTQVEKDTNSNQK